MEAHRYEVGDRVKVVRVRPYDSASVTVGAVGTMTTPYRKDATPDATYDHAVTFDVEGNDLVHDDEIEPLNEEAK